MRKLYLFAGLAIFFVVYLTVGVPVLVSLVETHGILVAFPICLLVYAILAYVLGAFVNKGPIAVVLFLFGFLLADIIAPPILVGTNGELPALASQQLSSDVFFYSAFVALGLSVTAAWWACYLGVPLLCAAVLIMELKKRAISRFIPNVML